VKKVLVGLGVVIMLVCFIVILKHPSAPPPPEKPAVTADQGASDESATAPAPAQAGAATAAPGETIVYHIQACVDEKATLALVGDKLQWSNLTGGGLNADTCAPEFRGKTTVQVAHNGESGEVHTYDTTAEGQFGPLPLGVPAKDPLGPATVEFSTEARQGAVTVTAQPTSPWYRVQVQFDDPDGFAHQYTAQLTLTYK
jgi:hypothetical protein